MKSARQTDDPDPIAWAPLLRTKPLAPVGFAGVGYLVGSLVALHILRTDHDPVAENVVFGGLDA